MNQPVEPTPRDLPTFSASHQASPPFGRAGRFLGPPPDRSSRESIPHQANMAAHIWPPARGAVPGCHLRGGVRTVQAAGGSVAVNRMPNHRAVTMPPPGGTLPATCRTNQEVDQARGPAGATGAPPQDASMVRAPNRDPEPDRWPGLLSCPRSSPRAGAGAGGVITWLVRAGRGRRPAGAAGEVVPGSWQRRLDPPGENRPLPGGQLQRAGRR